MPQKEIAAALAPLVGATLAAELVADFMQVRQDYATKTLGRASAGKFVETFVQSLQQMATGKYDKSPKVDAYLKDKVEQEGSLPESLRIAAARVARSIYTMRNKRSIAHKGEIDPNTIDIAYLHHGAAWIMSEMVRLSTSVTMEAAERMIRRLQAPVGELVEEIDGVRLVHGNPTVRAEVLILLHSHYPDPVSLAAVKTSLSRRGGATASNMLRQLSREKHVQPDAAGDYHLTSTGFAAAVREIDALLKATEAA